MWECQDHGCRRQEDYERLSSGLAQGTLGGTKSPHLKKMCPLEKLNHWEQLLWALFPILWDRAPGCLGRGGGGAGGDAEVVRAGEWLVGKALLFGDLTAGSV